jgi:hypothetical protein
MFKQASTGLFHTCAIDTNDEAQCWGLSDDSLLDFGQINPSIQSLL